VHELKIYSFALADCEERIVKVASRAAFAIEVKKKIKNNGYRVFKSKITLLRPLNWISSTYENQFVPSSPIGGLATKKRERK
jgi:hypothetical protein